MASLVWPSLHAAMLDCNAWLVRVPLIPLVDAAGQQTTLRSSDRAAEQGDEADEAGASDGASQLIPGVRRTNGGGRRGGVVQVKTIRGYR